MIGIDITKTSRFSHPINRYNERLGTSFSSVTDVAKCWACYEALLKANGKYFDMKDITITFPYNSAPQIHDPKKVLKGEFCLSLSHEDNIIIAVAIFEGLYND